MVFRKRSKGVVSDGYIWRTTAENTKIDGDYLDGTTHANLEAGLTACSKKSACSGVTQLSSDKFRLGKSSGTATKAKATGYFRGSEYSWGLWYKLETRGNNIRSRTRTNN